jgi:arsenate reductase
MSEGWARHLLSDTIEPHSAGVTPVGVDPWAVRAMAEVDVDISGHWSKALHDLEDIRFDYVVTVCDHARDVCPAPPPGARHLHVGFDDPPSLTVGVTDAEQKLSVYRRVRDDIRDFVQELPDRLKEARSPWSL